MNKEMKKLEIKDLKENFLRQSEKNGCWSRPVQKRSLIQ